MMLVGTTQMMMKKSKNAKKKIRKRLSGRAKNRRFKKISTGKLGMRLKLTAIKSFTHILKSWMNKTWSITFTI